MTQGLQTDDQRPLSPAQIVVFETPHLQNVRQTSTLGYEFVRGGPDGFTDTVSVHVRTVNPDGTKDLSFEFLTGPHRIAYPELDRFRGNPLMMLLLERDVLEMKRTLGVSAAYFRNRIREAFVSEATLTPTEVAFEGRTLPGQIVTIQPFAHDERLHRLPTVQQKQYMFVLADGVPGAVAEVRIEMPGDVATQLPAFSERVSFRGVTP